MKQHQIEAALRPDEEVKNVSSCDQTVSEIWGLVGLIKQAGAVLVVFLAIALPLAAQSISGSFQILSESDFNTPAPNRTEADCIVDDADCLFFREQRRPGTFEPIFYRDPIAEVNTGMTARAVIRQQAALLGWPLVGVYISGSGNVPHIAIPRTDFPSQGGSPELRADRLSTEMDLAIEGIYKSEAVINDPTDPDFGQTVELRFFFVAIHYWNYHADNNLYVQRGVDVNDNWVGDFLIKVDRDPPGNWWTEFQ